MPDDIAMPGAAQNTTETATANAPAPGGSPDQGKQTEPVRQQQQPANDPIDSFIAKGAAEKEDASDPADDGILTGKPEAQPDAGKTNGEGKPADKTADPYKPFALPDGFVEDPEAMGRLKDVAGRHKLTQEQAQEFVTAYAELEQKRNADQAAGVAKQNAEWIKEVKAHPEFGGANYKDTNERAAAMVRKYGSPRLTAELRQMGVQNYSELIFAFARIHKDLAEDASPGNASGASAVTLSDMFTVGK